MLASPDAIAASLVEDVLHPVEQLQVEEPFVPTPELLAPIAHVADVVPVAQHFLELRGRHWASRMAPGPSPQSSVGEFVSELFEAVVACGVQLEGQSDERCTFGVRSEERRV